MTTTSHFQINPDYYGSLDQVKKHTEKIQTNPRYRNFTQTHFTAGDEEQFQYYRGEYNGNPCIGTISLSKNMFRTLPLNFWPKYNNLHADSVINTFRYIFNKFKKGIFVKIVDNKLAVFLPFSKHGFINEWYENIHVDEEKYGSFLKFFEYISTSGGWHFNQKHLTLNPAEWYGNNCLIRSENPICEGDSNVDNVKNLLEELCEARQVPNIEFFINRRDFPILTRDGTEAYNHLWNSDKKQLVSHKYPQYAPIFSMCITDRYADVLMPTWEDWARIQSYENKFFSKPGKSYKETFDTKWSDKIPTAVFRGSTTGCGTDIDSSPRLKVSHMSAIQPSSSNGIPYLDAGITKWNLRPRKIQGEKYLKTIDIKKLGFGLINPLTPQQQSKYKYIINIDGNVSAYRLSLELGMGSVVLLVDSPWKIWYKSMLKPWVHYVPVKSDLSDLIEQIKWCRSNDDKCEIIAKNALTFFDTFLQKNGILDYFQKTLVDLSKKTGTYLYNVKTPLEISIEHEYSTIRRDYPEIDRNPSDLDTLPVFMPRCYGYLRGVEFTVRKILDEGVFEQYAKYQDLIMENKLGRVFLYNIAGEQFVVKSTSDVSKSLEHKHEAFIGIDTINKLSEKYPNFMYTYGTYIAQDGSTCTICEYIPGMTLFDYIMSKVFNMSDFLLILIQVLAAVQVAQRLCGFVHWDLTPWNIMIRESEIKTTTEYLLEYSMLISVTSRFTPVLIDYGKSHVIGSDGQHHGFINMFKMSTCQDMVNLLVTSISAILDREQRLDQKDLGTIFYLANFLSGTGYREDPFKTVADVKWFLRGARKYDNMINTCKFELEKSRPYNLMNYIMAKTYGYPILNNVELVLSPTSINNNMENMGNPRQVFEYAFCSSDTERLSTYTDCCKRLKNCTLPQPDNRLFIYYVAQTLEQNLLSVLFDMRLFLDGIKMRSDSSEKIFSQTIAFIDKLYKNLLKRFTDKEVKTHDKELPKNLEHAQYTPETWLLPRKIESLVKGVHKQEDPSEYIDLVEGVLLHGTGQFKLGKDDIEYYNGEFEQFLHADRLAMRNNHANSSTLLFLTERIYTVDMEWLDKQEKCELVTEYQAIYRDVLDTVKNAKKI